MSLQSSRFRDPKLLRPFSVLIAEVSQKKLHVIAINEARAAQEAKKAYRRLYGTPRVLSVEKEAA